MMSLDLQTALCILSLLGKTGVMRVNKIFYVVLSGFDSSKSKLYKARMPQTAYLLGIQEQFLTNLFLKHRKHHFAKKYSIKALQYTQKKL